jgi:hypothetical protein
LTAHEIKLKNTLAGIIETHQRTGKRRWVFMIIQNGKIGKNGQPFIPTRQL